VLLSLTHWFLVESGLRQLTGLPEIALDAAPPGWLTFVAAL